ncbi:MAG: hypothetical protein RL173_1761 [Fibrobacterota bacterium]|jgi:hypothetical protein
MRFLLALLLATLLATPAAAATDSLATVRDSSLVPKIDTSADTVSLKPAWMAGLKSAVVPGWGQFQTGHNIRGTTLMILDGWLYSDVIFRTATAIPKLREKARILEGRATSYYNDTVLWQIDSIKFYSDTSLHYPAEFMALDSIELKRYQSRLHVIQDSLSLIRGRSKISADYRNGELAWAIGLHVYAIADAAEDAWLAAGGKRPVTEMSSAIWRSLVLPGWGQVYNRRYSKAALLYMGIGGSLASFFSRQEMVYFWKAEARRAILEQRSITTASQQTEFFRKRRNQYIWGLGVVYVYQIMDAAVDARLSRFGLPFRLELEPQPQPDRPGLTANFRF